MLSMLFDVTDSTGGDRVVSFEVLDVPPRHDDHRDPWRRITVEEGPAVDGAWTAIVTGEIPRVDPDPEHPQPLGITVVGATRVAGWYRVTLGDDLGGAAVLEPVSGAHTDLPTAPGLDEVAALMLARVTDADDAPISVWNGTSTPTAAQVQKIIETVRQEVATKILWPIPAKWAEAARAVVALGTVAYLEQSKHPEAVSAGDSPFSTSRLIFLGRLTDLGRAVRELDWPLIA